jgi:hypothetical protein
MIPPLLARIVRLPQRLALRAVRAVRAECSSHNSGERQALRESDNESQKKKDHGRAVREHFEKKDEAWQID